MISKLGKTIEGQTCKFTIFDLIIALSFQNSIPSFENQCRSRSAGFRSQLIRSHTVFHVQYESRLIMKLNQRTDFETGLKSANDILHQFTTQTNKIVVQKYT